MSKPEAKIKDGTITATIWKNENKSDEGDGLKAFYSVDIQRSYKDKDDKWQSTSSFSGPELLRVANLAQTAYNHILHLKASDNVGEA